MRAAIRFGAAHSRIVKKTAGQGAPEQGAEFEIVDAPLASHAPKHLLKVILNVRMRAIQPVPWTVPPSAEGRFVGVEWRASEVLDEPIGMFAEQVGIAFRDEWRHPNCRFLAYARDCCTQIRHRAPKIRAGIKPIAHRGLVAVVDLNVVQHRCTRGNHQRIGEYFVKMQIFPQSVPGGPSSVQPGVGTGLIEASGTFSECGEGRIAIGACH